VSSDSDQGAANFDSDGFSYSEQALATQGLSVGAAINGPSTGQMTTTYSDGSTCGAGLSPSVQ
jgi:hypothetical protein